MGLDDFSRNHIVHPHTPRHLIERRGKKKRDMSKSPLVKLTSTIFMCLSLEPLRSSSFFEPGPHRRALFSRLRFSSRSVNSSSPFLVPFLLIFHLMQSPATTHSVQVTAPPRPPRLQTVHVCCLRARASHNLSSDASPRSSTACAPSPIQ